MKVQTTISPSISLYFRGTAFSFVFIERCLYHFGHRLFHGQKPPFLTHLSLFLPKKRVFLPKLCQFLPKKYVFFPKKWLFIPNIRKNRVKKAVFRAKIRSENRLISSEEKPISSEVIAISSEVIRFSSEEMPFSSEFGEQRKEKKYISIYISFSIYVVERARAYVRMCACYARTRAYAHAHKHRRLPKRKTHKRKVPLWGVKR